MLRAAIFAYESNSISDAEFITAVCPHLDGDALVAESIVAHGESHAPSRVVTSKALTLGTDTNQRSLEGRPTSEGEVHDFLQERNIVRRQSVTSRQERLRIHTLRHEDHLLTLLNRNLGAGTEVVIRIALQQATLFEIDKNVVNKPRALRALPIVSLPICAWLFEVEESHLSQYMPKIPSRAFSLYESLSP